MNIDCNIADGEFLNTTLHYHPYLLFVNVINQHHFGIYKINKELRKYMKDTFGFSFNQNFCDIGN